MMHYIENKFLKIAVKEKGAELSSFYSKEADFEYLWQGDEKFWLGQSPILFPIIGRLIDDKYTLFGKEYNLEKHGFARKTLWEFLGKGENYLKFRLSSNAETLEKYPFEFDLVVTFSINGKTLSVSHDVYNKGDKTMYFSLGAHPAFNCEMGDVLEFEKEENITKEKIDLEKALLMPEKFPMLQNEKEIVITEDIFNEDALILSGFQSDYITLKSDNHKRTVKVTFGGAPYLGIWAKPGAPYVCIEPWYGVNDTFEKKDFNNKYQIRSLEKGGKFNFTWTAEVSE